MACDSPTPRESFLKLLHSDELMVFVQEKSQLYESRESFDGSPMPCGLAPDEAWELVSFVRRMSGWPPVSTQVPRAGKPLTPDLAFQTTPPSVEIAVNELTARCGVHSTLWKSLEPLIAHRRIIQPLVDELSAACHRDGLSLGSEAIRSIVLGTAAAQTDGERLVENTVALLRSAPPDGFPDYPSLRRIYEELVAGTCLTASAANTAPPASSFPEAFAMKSVSFQELSSEMGSMEQWGAHPLLGIIISSSALWTSESTGPANAFFELVLRAYSLTRIGLPALACVPSLFLRISWERGDAPELLEPFRYGEAFLISEFGLDCTPYLIQMLSMMTHYVDRLEQEVAALVSSDRKRQEAIVGDVRLSHRQKELLSAMIADPTATADVRGYAERFDCAVSTARDDLNRLVDLCYCSTAYQGKRQVFWLNPLD